MNRGRRMVKLNVHRFYFVTSIDNLKTFLTTKSVIICFLACLGYNPYTLSRKFWGQKWFLVSLYPPSCIPVFKICEDSNDDGMSSCLLYNFESESEFWINSCGNTIQVFNALARRQNFSFNQHPEFFYNPVSWYRYTSKTQQLLVELLWAPLQIWWFNRGEHVLLVSWLVF